MTPTPSTATGLTGERLCVRYHARQPFVLNEVSLAIPPGKISAFIGPNGSGKSTLLKTLARQLKPESGRVLLDGADLAQFAPRQLAQRIGILFQENIAPGDLTVERLVYHGRYPHRKLFEPLTAEDHEAVAKALRLTGVAALRERRVSHLSSGQRQLSWVAMLLAQAPDCLFLDEPTTFLDLAHQFDVMDCLQRLNRQLGQTIVLVVHDLNLAARYADRLFALRDGRLVATGPPAEVLTPETIRRVFDVETRVLDDGPQGLRFCLPVKKSAAGESPS
ncbi:MAG TPA: ABC transporter ATP-binding protein [Dongiaceae bacterium]|jgi:iron complex transport system ATP-binding protein|nr:ABC transporter ATP-binding protein [Dongiaceae bacterium]